MIIINYSDFSFKMRKISDLAIEDVICEHCEIGGVDQSRFEPSLMPIDNKKNVSYHDVHIFGSRNNLNCRICIIREGDKYIIEVSHITISRGSLKHT